MPFEVIMSLRNHSSFLGGVVDPRYGEVGRPRGLDSWYVPVKATFDFVFAAVLLVLCLPLILLLMVVVKLTSRGPALYTQERLGLGGRPFTIFKIRTMTHECEKLSGPCWATASDPRVTRLGRFLRRSHLDELPQLWNVLRGEMSLVGPRPERPVFVAELELAIPEYRERLRVRPGVSGLAQVQLPPDTDLAGVRRKIVCDLDYINRLGPGLDARILLATAFMLVGVPCPVTARLLRLPGVQRTARSEQEAAPHLQIV
jgi:lipopolysaccharide/colanic/teichoic acid biosynthesis glycosyltransferase